MSLNIAVSPDDASQLHALAPASRIAVIPNGVDTEYFAPDPAANTEGCVFVGGTNWFPNRDGLDWFAGSIAPLITQRRPGTSTRWVGHVTARERETYQNPALTLTGYVDDVRPFVHAASCFVVPLRVGGGTRLKVLDAWAMGKAVVSTSLGCEGLATVPGENIIIADDAATFADAVVAVAGDKDLQRRLGAAGRRTVEDKYGWQALGKELRELYRGLIYPGQEAGDGRAG